MLDPTFKLLLERGRDPSWQFLANALDGLLVVGQGVLLRTGGAPLSRALADAGDVIRSPSKLAPRGSECSGSAERFLAHRALVAELVRFVVELATSQARPFLPRQPISFRHGVGSRLSATAAVHEATVVGRFGGRPMRQHRRHLWRSVEHAPRFSPGISSNKKPAGVVRREPSIVNSLDSGDRVRQILTNNKVVIRIVVARGEFAGKDGAF